MFCLMRYLKQIIDSFITFPICICCFFLTIFFSHRRIVKKKLGHHFIAYDELAMCRGKIYYRTSAEAYIFEMFGFLMLKSSFTIYLPVIIWAVVQVFKMNQKIENDQ